MQYRNPETSKKAAQHFWGGTSPLLTREPRPAGDSMMLHSAREEWPACGKLPGMHSGLQSNSKEPAKLFASP